METIKSGWDFFQNQILGMHWLKDLIGTLLEKAGVGMGRFPGEVIQVVFNASKEVRMPILNSTLIIVYGPISLAHFWEL